MSDVYYGVEPYSGKIIQHFGIPGMKWGWTKDGKKTGAKEAMTEQERLARRQKILKDLRSSYNTMKGYEKQASNRVNEWRKARKGKGIIGRTAADIGFSVKNIGAATNPYYWINKSRYNKNRRLAGLKKGDNVNKAFKKNYTF